MVLGLPPLFPWLDRGELVVEGLIGVRCVRRRPITLVGRSHHPGLLSITDANCQVNGNDQSKSVFDL